MKIRLHGVPEQIDKFVEIFEKLESSDVISILQKSNIYSDRGMSKYSRMYLDVELKWGINEN